LGGREGGHNLGYLLAAGVGIAALGAYATHNLPYGGHNYRPSKKSS